MSSHRSQGTSTGNDLGPMLSGLLILTCITIGLPAALLGYLAQRFTSRYAWSFTLWFVLLVPAALGTYYFYTHGLQQMIVQEVGLYIQNAKHFPSDLTRWDWWRLWIATWAVWLRTLVAVPFVGVLCEMFHHARPGKATNLAQEEVRRQQRVARAHMVARKRALHPERVPDQVQGLMVMGIPIDDKEQE